MRCSAVIPTLEEAERIGPTVRSLLEQGFSEVVVVDGGSRDATVERAEQVGARCIQAERGRGNQLSAGAKAAREDTLLFLHADVRLPPNALGWMALALQAPGVVAGAFRTWHVDDTEGARVGPLLRLADLRSRYTGKPYGDQGLFLHRAQLQAAGGYPELPLMEDLELARRLRRLGRIWTLPTCVEVSGRRFASAPIRYGLLMNVMPLAWRMGVPAESLARLYRNPR